MKPLVMKVFDAQLKHCNQLAEEAKKAFAQESLDDDSADEATAKLYQVRERYADSSTIFANDGGCTNPQKV